jgi:cytochrome b6-f complex iron-sulfur subunit
LKYPVFVIRTNEDNYTALYMQCTHKGCELNATSKRLSCPCHGSEFDTSGKVLRGPAEKPLLSLPVTSESENILLHLNWENGE